MTAGGTLRRHKGTMHGMKWPIFKEASSEKIEMACEKGLSSNDVTYTQRPVRTSGTYPAAKEITTIGSLAPFRYILAPVSRWSIACQVILEDEVLVLGLVVIDVGHPDVLVFFRFGWPLIFSTCSELIVRPDAKFTEQHVADAGTHGRGHINAKYRRGHRARSLWLHLTCRHCLQWANAIRRCG